jgi:hypothetical protein
MKFLFIDAAAQKVSEIQIGEGNAAPKRRELMAAIGTNCKELAVIVPENDSHPAASGQTTEFGKNCLLFDEAAMDSAVDNIDIGFFRFQDEMVAGNALIANTDEYGDAIDTKLSVELIEKYIAWAAEVTMQKFDESGKVISTETRKLRDTLAGIVIEYVRQVV